MIVELSRVIQAVSVRALEKFANDSANELVIGINAPHRPSPLAQDDDRPWSAFINLRNEIVTQPMRAWIEATLQEILRTRWPEGWYHIAGPVKSPRLGVQSQLRKTTSGITGPLSNHQKLEAMRVLGPLYQTR